MHQIKLPVPQNGSVDSNYLVLIGNMITDQVRRFCNFLNLNELTSTMYEQVQFDTFAIWKFCSIAKIGCTDNNLWRADGKPGADPGVQIGRKYSFKSARTQ